MEITAELAREILHYDKESGSLLWLPRGIHLFGSLRAQRIWTTKYSGKAAGYRVKYRDLYWAMAIGMPDKKCHLAHRVIWLYMTGSWPDDQIDHIDQNPMNNAWDNLRSVNNQENHLNRPRQSNNRSGVTGVYWHSQAKKWHARIKVGGKNIHIGLFAGLADAAKAREKANIRFGFLPGHGRDLQRKEYLSPNLQRYM